MREIQFKRSTRSARLVGFLFVLVFAVGLVHSGMCFTPQEPGPSQLADIHSHSHSHPDCLIHGNSDSSVFAFVTAPTQLIRVLDLLGSGQCRNFQISGCGIWRHLRQSVTSTTFFLAIPLASGIQKHEQFAVLLI